MTNPTGRREEIRRAILGVVMNHWSVDVAVSDILSNDPTQALVEALEAEFRWLGDRSEGWLEEAAQAAFEQDKKAERECVAKANAYTVRQNLIIAALNHLKGEG